MMCAPVCVCSASRKYRNAADGQACDRDGAAARGRSAPRLGPADSPARLKSRAQFSHYSPRGRQQRPRRARARAAARAFAVAARLARCTHAPRATAQNPGLFRGRRTAMCSRCTNAPGWRVLSSPTGEQGVDQGAAQELSPMHAPPRTLASAIGRTPAAREEQRTGHERTSTLRCEG